MKSEIEVLRDGFKRLSDDVNEIKRLMVCPVCGGKINDCSIWKSKVGIVCLKGKKGNVG